MLSETLIIGGWSSSCGNCNRAADPNEQGHFTLLGYGPDNGKPGCQTIWKYITSEYIGDHIVDTVKRMRPDLEFVDYGVG